MFENLPTPALLLDHDRLVRNIARMQAACDAHGVELRPHIKTHKMVEVARLQIAAGARGLCCAKIGEAEAMLPSGVSSIFIAYPLVDVLHGPRLRALADTLDELIVACTSEAQAEALEHLLARVDLQLPVMLAVDSGLGREGARGEEAARRLAARIGCLPHLTLHGIYTHEGHAYAAGASSDAFLADVHERVVALRNRIDPDLPLWPGCSITAERMAALPGVNALRPGAYVFGDLMLAADASAMRWEDVAVTVLAAVVDRPAPDLALLDAGSKTFSGDKTPRGRSGSLLDRRDIHVTRCSEEHGWATGNDVDGLKIGERVRVVPAHICPVINLADEVTVIHEGTIVDTWRVAARGCVR